MTDLDVAVSVLSTAGGAASSGPTVHDAGSRAPAAQAARASKTASFAPLPGSPVADRDLDLLEGDFERLEASPAPDPFWLDDVGSLTT